LLSDDAQPIYQDLACALGGEDLPPVMEDNRWLAVQMRVKSTWEELVSGSASTKMCLSRRFSPNKSMHVLYCA
jgi:hypothetical protein